MWDKTDQINMATLMANFENALSKLYSIYSTKLPAFSVFWHDLSVEEKTHAFMIETLKPYIIDGSWAFEERSFQINEIKSNAGKVNNQIDYANQNEISIREALSFAMEVESLMIERNVFEIKNGDSSGVKEILKTLHEDTVRHREQLKNLYAELVNK